ncbi:LysR family transcriptional regulator [Thalassotalea atypica]|uniref:LysR family transcriptional regulator n=1 Tax=Thalassotalea atypica TaxID=2054316 RepID=UPI0025722477|nr:LysR family transcriptional regulator [Thalassotalea atypica]
MNWDDIKIFLEVARTERLSEAANRLSIDTSTVSRRLHKLEEQLATQLFERTTEGHRLTKDGAQLVSSARRMEQDAQYAFDNIKQNNADNSGKVRIGVTEAFGNYFIAPKLVNLSKQAPNIQIDLLHFSRDVKISRNEAEIAIAVEKPKSTSMIVTKLTDYKLQLYANKKIAATIDQHAGVQTLSQYNWVSYVDTLLFTRELSYIKDLSENVNNEIKPKFQSTSIVSQFSAIKSGLGIGVLPCFLGDTDPELVKIFSNNVNIERSFWLVTHPEIKRLSRVDTVWQYLKLLVKEHQSRLNPP